MEVNRQLVFRQPLVNRKQLFAIQSLAVEIGETAEAAQAELIDRALELIERRFDIAGRQGEKPDEAFGMRARDRRDGVIGDARDLNRVSRLRSGPRPARESSARGYRCPIGPCA